MKRNENNKRKKEDENEEQPIKKIKLSTHQSAIFLKAHAYHDGNWRKIMKDKKIVELKKDERALKKHLEYLR